MEDNQQNSPFKSQSKDKVLVLNNIVNDIEKGTGVKLHELKKRHLEEHLFYIALKHVTTTKKTLCEALKIPIEAGCRYKRSYEKRGLLKESLNDVVCPYTKHFARLISTNPNEFERLTYTNQLRMF